MAKTDTEKTAAYQARMKAAGYARIPVWVPDTAEGRAAIQAAAKALRDGFRPAGRTAESDGSDGDLSV